MNGYKQNENKGVPGILYFWLVDERVTKATFSAMNYRHVISFSYTL